MDTEAAVRSAFPEVEEMEDHEMRTGVIDAWTRALDDTGVDDLGGVPWYPPAQKELDLPDEYLVPHVRDVTAGAVALAEILIDRRGESVDLDTVVGGALIHDIGKLYEFDGMAATAVGEMIGHPYYGLYPVAAAGLPVEFAHIVLSHTPRTNVEPATVEAEIVRRADEVAAAAIRGRGVDDLRDA